MSPLHAVVPAKCFSRAKSRLDPVLSADERAQLAAAMLAHVLRVITGSRGVGGTLVVCDDEGVAAFALAHGVQAMLHPSGLGPSVASAVSQLLERGDGVMVVMADLVQLTADDLRALVDAAGSTAVALAPDRHEDGTSALVVPTGLRAVTRFGEPGSFALHLAEAHRRGLRSAVVRRPGLALDIDTPADLELAAVSVAAARAAGSARPRSWTGSSQRPPPGR